MAESKNSAQLEDQLKTLLLEIKDIEQNEVEVDIKLHIYSIKETERESKKVYVLSLCDNKYKYNSFFLSGLEEEDHLEKGKIIHLKEVSPKRIKTNLFIRIKKYNVLNDSIEIGKVKDLKLENGIFRDEEGNDIENKYGYFKNALESNFQKLDNLGKDLYDDDFWKDFDYGERG